MQPPNLETLQHLTNRVQPPMKEKLSREGVDEKLTFSSVQTLSPGRTVTPPRCTTATSLLRDLSTTPLPERLATLEARAKKLSSSRYQTLLSISAQALHARSTSTSEWEFRCDFPTSTGTNCEISRYTSQMACTSLVEEERYLSEAVVEQARQRGQSIRADLKTKSRLMPTPHSGQR